MSLKKDWPHSSTVSDLEFFAHSRSGNVLSQSHLPIIKYEMPHQKPG